MPLKGVLMPPVKVDPSKVKTFESALAFDRWFSVHHHEQDEVWIRIYKVGSGRKSITPKEAIDVCLCWGWIDAVRKRCDEKGYLQRYTRRDVVQRSFEFDTMQPPSVGQPVEDGDARVDFKIELVCVGAAIAGSLSRAELIHNIEVGTEPAACALGGKPDKVRLELELRRAVRFERQEDRFDREAQPRYPCRVGQARESARSPFLVDLALAPHRPG
jgi:hypothetical protein